MIESTGDDERLANGVREVTARMNTVIDRMNALIEREAERHERRNA